VRTIGVKATLYTLQIVLVEFGGKVNAKKLQFAAFGVS